MENINIKVAFCLSCGGYHSATPADSTQINHPEIIDHFFYHGEPWFTLSAETFKKAEILEKTEVRTMSLEKHQMCDQEYCTCRKRVNSNTFTPVQQFSGYYYAEPVQNKISETELYFRDVYSLSYNFH